MSQTKVTTKIRAIHIYSYKSGGSFFIFGSAAMQVLSKTDERAFEANNLSLYTTSTLCGILINLGLTISTLVLLRKITVAQEKAIKSAL